jgi:hypothetical protein
VKARRPISPIPRSMMFEIFLNLLIKVCPYSSFISMHIIAIQRSHQPH